MSVNDVRKNTRRAISPLKEKLTLIFRPQKFSFAVFRKSGSFLASKYARTTGVMK